MSYKRSVSRPTPDAFPEAYLPSKGDSAMNRLQWLQIWGFNAISDHGKQRAPDDVQKFAALMRRLSARTSIPVRVEEELEA